MNRTILNYRLVSRRIRHGYTLIEVLVVVVIIVLMLGMAIPVFRLITGSRSEAGATNVIASMLSHARADAIGLQQPIGVALVYNPSTQLSYVAEVNFPNCQAWGAGTSVTTPLSVPPQGTIYATIPNPNYVANNPYTPPTLTLYFINSNQSAAIPLTAPPPPGLTQTDNPGGVQYLLSVGGPPLDMVTDTDLVALAPGIGVQTLSSCNVTNSTPAQRTTNGYLSMGVILFDGHGRLTSQYYGVSRAGSLSLAAGLSVYLPNGQLTGHDYPVSNIGEQNYLGSIIQYGVGSQFGCVVFQKDAFLAQSFPLDDPAYVTATANQPSAYASGSPSAEQKDTWMDTNSTPLLMDRYTGTLIKAE